ncbi:MAG TPA: diguanylate cyclase [Peptococcaceae bacterium]|nr:diguanylate cyclase [Peptococcaceae bacterium]
MFVNWWKRIIGNNLKTVCALGVLLIVFLTMIVFLDARVRCYFTLPIFLGVFYILFRANQLLRREIDNYKQTQKALAYSESLFRGIFNNASAGISLLNREGKYRHCNLTLCRMLGYSEEELKNKSFHEITFPADLELSIKYWQDIWEGRRSSVSFEKRFICKNGDILWAEANISAIRGEGAEVTDAIAVIIDISVRKRMEEELRHQATTDFLTGADNRRAFMQKTKEEFVRARRYKRGLALLLLDIDKFKEVNDCYGHLVGDRILREVVKACRSILRQTDILARIGGEEFAAILLESDLAKAKTVALRIQEKIKETIVISGDSKVQVTVSIGIATLKDEDFSLEDTFKRADAALYLAKESGRNRIVTEQEVAK